MDSEIEIVEERLKSFLGQLQTEFGILDRVVYKYKNQHRRSSYFHYLLKVRRDLRLLKSAHLEDILNSSFLIINGKRPRQKVQLLESLKRRRYDKHNFLERLLGVARLLSQMVEPMLKAATYLSTLHAQSFFMEFSVTVLALLARLRVLIQQILLDVVSVFNMVSSLSQKEQSVKLTQEGFEVFREYHPTNEESISLECVWEKDQFVLVERTNRSEIRNQEMCIKEEVSLGASTIQYQSIEVLLGDNETGKVDHKDAFEGAPANITEDNTSSSFPAPVTGYNDGKQVDAGPANVKEDNTSSSSAPFIECNDGKQVDDGSVITRTPSKNLPSEDGLFASSSPSLNLSKCKSRSREKVAFVSVKRPALSSANGLGWQTENTVGDKEDPFFNLLTGGNMKDDESGKVNPKDASEEGPPNITEDNTSSSPVPVTDRDDGKQVDDDSSARRWFACKFISRYQPFKSKHKYGSNTCNVNSKWIGRVNREQ